MEKQFVGFGICCRAIVARDFHIDAFRDQGAFERLQPLKDFAGDYNGVRARPFGDGHRHRRLRAEGAGFAGLDGPDAGIGFGACDAYRRDITQIDDAPACAPDLEPFEFVNGVYAVARLDDQ